MVKYLNTLNCNIIMAFEIKSPAFENGNVIPEKYTCDGENVSPPLKWHDVPAETKSLVLICDDPDAPLMTWVHWLIYCIPPSKNGLEENIPRKEVLEWGGKQGKNSWGKIGYGGPCPPGKKQHRYFFRLYALNEELNLPAGLKKKELLKRIERHVIGKAEIMGKYGRK